MDNHQEVHSLANHIHRHQETNLHENRKKFLKQFMMDIYINLTPSFEQCLKVVTVTILWFFPFFQWCDVFELPLLQTCRRRSWAGTWGRVWGPCPECPSWRRETELGWWGEIAGFDDSGEPGDGTLSPQTPITSALINGSAKKIKKNTPKVSVEQTKHRGKEKFWSTVHTG